MTTGDNHDGLIWAACTLPTVERPLRAAEFDDLFTGALRGSERPAPTRLLLRLDPAAEDMARDLAIREADCCSFFTYTFTYQGADLLLAVEVPPAHTDVLDAVAARFPSAGIRE